MLGLRLRLLLRLRLRLRLRPRFGLGLAFVLVLALASCGDDGTSPMTEPVTWIRGQVHTTPDSRPGVVTVERWSSRSPRIRATLDIDGNFAVPVPEGVYLVRLEMPDVGYFVQRDGTIAGGADSIFAAEGMEIDLDIQLGSALVTFDFPEEYTNTLVQIDVSNESLRIQGSYRWDRTEDRQTFRIAHLPPGNYEYWTDLGSSRYPNIRFAHDEVTRSRIEIVGGEEQVYDAVLPRQAWIEFVLSDPSERVEGRLEPYPAGGRSRFFAVGGGVSILPFIADSCVVWALIGSQRYLGPTGISRDPIPLKLDPEEALRLPIEFHRLLVEPLDHRVRLDLFNERGEPDGQVYVDSDPILWPDLYRARIEPSSSQFEELGVGQWVGGVARMSESEPIDLRYGNAQISWEPAQGGTLRGSLARPEPNGDAIYLIPLWNQRGGYVARTTTADDYQHFEITRAPVGEFFLVLYNSTNPDGYYFPGVSTPDSATVIVIEPGAEIDGLDWAR